MCSLISLPCSLWQLVIVSHLNRRFFRLPFFPFGGAALILQVLPELRVEKGGG